MAFRFSGTTIVGPRGDSCSLMFECRAEGASFTDRDRLVFVLSRRMNGGVVLRRDLLVDDEGRAQLDLTHEETRALTPGRYVWSARYVLDAVVDESGHVTDGNWVDTPWRNCEFEVQEVNGQV